MFVCCVCVFCIGIGLSERMIARSEESRRVCLPNCMCYIKCLPNCMCYINLKNEAN